MKKNLNILKTYNQYSHQHTYYIKYIKSLFRPHPSKKC
jgi:hypothetical protein